MQDTGIVRRIDELGRVVIPKELRKTLRIREGDPLEIYTENERLIFRKYSPIASINAHADAVAEGIYDATQKTCVITDNDEVVTVAGGKGRFDVGESISNELERIMKNRKSVTCKKRDGKTIRLFKGERAEDEYQVIVPIVSAGDCYGSVIVIGNGDGQTEQEDLKLAKLGAAFLSKQFE